MFKATCVPMVAVACKGCAPLAADVMAGHIPLGTDARGSELKLPCGGRIRMLGVIGMPRELLKKPGTALLVALQSQSVQAGLVQIGLEPAAVPGAMMTRMMGEERSYAAPVVKATGFTVSK